MPFRLWAALAGVVALAGFLTFSHRFAYNAGRSAEREAMLARSIEILRERNATDDQISNMDDAELCSALDGQWVPDTGTCI